MGDKRILLWALCVAAASLAGCEDPTLLAEVGVWGLHTADEWAAAPAVHADGFSTAAIDAAIRTRLAANGAGEALSPDPTARARLNSGVGNVPSPGQEERIRGLQRSLSMPLAQPENFYETRVGQLALPDGVQMVDPRSFHAALSAAGTSAQGSAASLRTGVVVASMGGDLAASGVFASIDSVQENRTVSGSVWVVPRALAMTADGKLIASSYSVEHVELTIDARWVSSALAIAIRNVGESGSARCCGPAFTGSIANQPSLPGDLGGVAGCSDGPRPGYCTPDIYFGDKVSPDQDSLRNANGLAAVPFSTYTGRGAERYSFNGPRAGQQGFNACTVMRFKCDVEPIGRSDGTNPEATVPQGHTCTGTPIERSLGGRQMDRACIFASGWFGGPGASGNTLSFGSGTFAPGAVCDGQCPDCGTPTSAFNLDVLPKQCAYSKSVPGSGVCEGTTTTEEVARMQTALKDWLVARSGGSCGGLSDPLSRCACEAADANGRQECVTCSGNNECHHYTRVTDRLAPIATEDAGGTSPLPDPKCDAACMANPPQEDPATPSRKPLVHRDAPAEKVDQSATAPTKEKERQETLMERRMQDGGQPNQGTPKPADAVTHAGQSRGNGSKGKSKPVSAADPVALLDGAFTLEHIDLTFEGPVRSLEFRRSYSSRSATRSILGSNWTHNWDMRVIALRKENMPAWIDPYCAGSPNETTCAILEREDTVIVFSRDEASGLFLPQAGSVNTLASNVDGTWAMRAPDGHTWTFDVNGYVTQDRDRFGNGFKIEYESTPWGTLRQAVCPAPAFELVDGVWTARRQLETGASALLEGCALLRGMTGESNVPWWEPSVTVGAAMFPLPAGSSAEASLARTWAIARQADGFGTGSPFGQHPERPISVTDDMGRKLRFHYEAATGLLASVDGPSGTHVLYRYLNSQVLSPVGLQGLGKYLLTEVERHDDAVPNGPEATPPRGFVFHYAVENEKLMPSTGELDLARQRYLEYYESFLNCGFQSLDQCGQRFASGFRFARTGPMVDMERKRLQSAAADNITRVDVVTFIGGAATLQLIESETRYDNSVFSVNYDKVRAQRWGDAGAYRPLAEPVDPLGQPWETTSPIATLNYVQAGPDLSGGAASLGDATDSFLEPDLLTRYPLEDVDSGAQYEAGRLGNLLPPNAPLSTVIPNRRPLLLAGEVQVRSDGTVAQQCAPAAIPHRKAALPGYRPEYLYFDKVLSDKAKSSSTSGVDLDDTLQRSRLSCDQLAVAQTVDVAHNDLATTRTRAASQIAAGLPGTAFDTVRILGRRTFTAANANRICAWTRLVDRDGDTHVFGLNYHGNVLVDAIKMRDDSWRFAEQLYNADGNVVAKRQVLPGTVVWSVNAGDTRYKYEDYKPAENSYGVAFPLYWSRRFNVVEEVVSPKDGPSVKEEDEKTFTESASIGRYTRFDYEWFFNEPLQIEWGSIRLDGTRIQTSSTSYFYDFQELPLTGLNGLLDELQSWGAAFPKPNGSWDYAGIDARLPMRFPVGKVDLNGDGIYGLLASAPVAEPWRLARGVPVRISMSVPAQHGLSSETTMMRWNTTGRPYWVQEANGTVKTFRYYTNRSYEGAIKDSKVLSSGGTGFLGEVWRRPRVWDKRMGPAAGGCGDLGPYRGLLASGCGNKLIGLAALKLPQETIDAIVGYLKREEPTRFDYYVTGALFRVQDAGGERVRTERDTDGRELKKFVLDATKNLAIAQETTTSYDDLRRPVAEVVTDDRGFLTATRWQYDAEGRITWNCTEAISGACLPLGQNPSLDPTQGALGSRTLATYSAEGALRSTTDPEGMVTVFTTDARKWTLDATTKSTSSDESRFVRYLYDDRGFVKVRTRGGGGTTLTQTTVWDGLDRTTSLSDEDGRQWSIGYSVRDLQTSIKHASTPSWMIQYSYDAYGRRTHSRTNGITTESLQRIPGGEIYAQSGDGVAKQYTTYDALGRPVWGQDGAGNQWVRTYQWGSDASPLRRETASRIRRSGALIVTNSFVRDLNVQGNSVTETEYGDGLSRTATSVRDGLGRATHQVDVDGAVTEEDFDGLGRRKKLRQQRTLNGTATTDFEVSTFSFDRRGNLLSLGDPSGWTTTQTYGGFGEPETRTLRGTPDVVTTWTYDELGRIRRKTVGPSLVDITYNYTGARLMSWTRGDAVLRDFHYDGLGRLRQAHNYNLGQSGLAGSPWPSATDRTVESTFEYDELGRAKLQTSKIANRTQRTVRSAWSLSGNNWQRVTTLPNSTTLVENFDGNGRFASVSHPGGGASNFSWLGELPLEWSTTKTGSSMRRKYSYDGLGQLIAVMTTAVDIDGSGNPLATTDGAAVCRSGWSVTCGAPTISVNIRRDVKGRIGSFSASQHRPTAGNFLTEEAWRGYGYDAIGRISLLREAPRLPSLVGLPNNELTVTQLDSIGDGMSPQADRWVYEREGGGKVGNLTAISMANGVAPPRFVAARRTAGQQLSRYANDNSSPIRTVTHDAAGRVTSDGSQRLFWDDAGSLVGVSIREDSDSLREGLLYDGLGRLVMRADSAFTYGDELVWDRQQIVAAFATDPVASLKWTATWGPGVDRLLSIKAGATTYLAMEDGKANVVGYYNANTNKLAVWADFTPEGRMRVSRPGTSDEAPPVVCQESGQLRCGLPPDMAFGLHGSYRSVGTTGGNLGTRNSTGLYYFRNRWYSAEAGQFLSQDDMGYVDGFNAYAFNRGDAINLTDSFGLDSSGPAARSPDPGRPSTVGDTILKMVLAFSGGLPLMFEPPPVELGAGGGTLRPPPGEPVFGARPWDWRPPTEQQEKQRIQAEAELAEKFHAGRCQRMCGGAPLSPSANGENPPAPSSPVTTSSGAIPRSPGGGGARPPNKPGVAAAGPTAPRNPPSRPGSKPPFAGGGAVLENISRADALRIQNAANRIGKQITVVGSRAKGSADANDWDFVIEGNHAIRHSASSSLPGSRDTTEGSPVNQDILKGPVNPTEPHITFFPQ